MLPLIVGEAEIPDFLEEKIYLDLRTEYYSGLARVSGMVHGLSEFRIARALASRSPQSVLDVWRVLESVGFEPYVVLGNDDFDEIMKHGRKLLRQTTRVRFVHAPSQHHCLRSRESVAQGSLLILHGG